MIRTLTLTLLISLALGLIAEHSIRAQEPSKTETSWGNGLVTDRPLTTISSKTLDLGVVHSETGFTWLISDFKNSDTTRFSLFQEVVRIGLGQPFEADVFWNGLLIDTAPNTSTSGAGDPGIALRVHLFDEESPRPSLGAQIQATFPVGSDGFTPGLVELGFMTKAEWTLSDLFSQGLFLRLDIATRDSDAKQYVNVFTLSAPFVITATPQVVFYVEPGFSVPLRDNADATVFVGLAGVFLITNDVQFDIGATFGLTDAAPDLTLALGLCIRFDLRAERS